jgi:hypothetical protein
MKKTLSLLFALITWFAIITQYVLMMDNRVTSITESSIRFFSFFTILTNSLVAIYFSGLLLKAKFTQKSGTLTAITVYITIVGIVYQIALRHIWDPQGMQWVVDELLHTVIPILVILFWCFYEISSRSINYTRIFSWALYPVIYFGFVLVRGHFSGFYPYPFINVSKIGLANTLLNASILIMVFGAVSALFIFLGKLFSRE